MDGIGAVTNCRCGNSIFCRHLDLDYLAKYRSEWCFTSQYAGKYCWRMAYVFSFTLGEISI